MSKETFYNTIAEDFDSIMNMYDTNRRIEVIFKDFLSGENLENKSLLDAGCGTGHFTGVALEKRASVTSLDIAPKLVEITKTKYPQTDGVVGSLLDLPFEDNHFDYVISSDVIEHTPDPYAAVLEMIRVLKPEGKLCITVPNRSFWYFSLIIAEKLNLRNYQGFENWVHYNQLRNFLKKNGINVKIYKGIHLFPFVVNFLNPLLYRLDKITENKIGRLMVNVAAYGSKKK